MRAEQVTDVVTEHGEGPVWWPGWGGLRLVDTFAGDVVHVAQDGTVSRWHVADVVTSLRPRAAGGVVLATRDGFATADAPGGPVRVVADGVVPAPQRMNDGGCDPYGSFWCGSYDPTGRGAGALFRLGPDDELSRELDGVHVSNGIVWTSDGRTAYYADSGPRRVDRFHFDGRRLVAREPFVTIEDGAATTDGLCLDAEGGLWVALWEGHEVRRYDSSGRLDAVVELPVAKVTACTFGGPDLSDLWITTSRLDEPDPHPAAGAVFRVVPGVQGLPTATYAG